MAVQGEMERFFREMKRQDSNASDVWQVQMAQIVLSR